jgi:hypothetical protein
MALLFEMDASHDCSHGWLRAVVGCYVISRSYVKSFFSLLRFASSSAPANPPCGMTMFGLALHVVVAFSTGKLVPTGNTELAGVFGSALALRDELLGVGDAVFAVDFFCSAHPASR